MLFTEKKVWKLLNFDTKNQNGAFHDHDIDTSTQFVLSTRKPSNNRNKLMIFAYFTDNFALIKLMFTDHMANVLLHETDII